jgi:uncharacterized damage-inducible protein DinB
MRRDLLAAVEGLSEELMTERTLDGWSVKDHLAHLAAWDEIRTSEVERISAGFDSAWRMTADQDAVYNALAHALRQDLSVGQVMWELERTHERLLVAIRAATPRALDAALYGEAALRSTHDAQHTGWIRRWREDKRV